MLPACNLELARTSRQAEPWPFPSAHAMLPPVCTVVVLVRPEQIFLAAHRDERVERAWDTPAAWWPERPGVIAGRDRTGGGTWMGINQHAVVATVH